MFVKHSPIVDSFTFVGTNFFWIELKWYIHGVQNLWP